MNHMYKSELWNMGITTSFLGTSILQCLIEGHKFDELSF